MKVCTHCEAEHDYPDNALCRECKRIDNARRYEERKALRERTELVLVQRHANGKALYACMCGEHVIKRTKNVNAGVTWHCGAAYHNSNYTESPRYWTAHSRVKAERGSASLYLCACGCGRQASDWAYMHSDPDEMAEPLGRVAGMPYSASPRHYLPWSRACHFRLDAARQRATPGLSLPHHALMLAAGR